MISIIWNSIVDNIPWWAYIIALVVVLMLTYQVWAPLWALAPKPLKAAVVGVAAVFTAYIAGRNRGASNARAADKENTNQALSRRHDIDQKVNNMTPSQVDKELDKRGDFRD